MGDTRLDRVLRRQHGIISRQQALASGLSKSKIKRLLHSEEWVRMYRGVYRHRVIPVTWHSKLIAACLAVNGIAYRRSSAVLHSVEGFRPVRREILVPRGTAQRAAQVPDADVHETADFGDVGRVIRNGIPCTGLARTVVDLASCCDHRTLGAAVDGLVRDRKITLPRLYGALAKYGGQGRTGCKLLRQVLDQRMGEHELPLSDWSRGVADLLEANGLPSPVLEYKVLRPGRKVPYQIDLAYPDQRVAIELDSLQWHFGLDAFHNDRERANWLIENGWTVLRFTWRDFTDRPAELVATVGRVLAQQ